MVCLATSYFINDIGEQLLSLTRLFADDASLGYSSPSPDTLELVINHDLNKLSTWSGKWLMSFNPEKNGNNVIFLICLNGTYHSCPKLHTRIQRWDEYKLNAIFLSFVYSFYILIFLILLKAYLYFWQYFLRHGARSTLRHEIMLHLNVYDCTVRSCQN
jgi:hypothetical protein